jgi:hypothetical protein
MAQCEHRSTQHVRSEPVVDDCAVSFQIDFESRKRSGSILGMRCDRVTRPDKQGTMQAKRCDRVGRRKFVSREDRLYDFETVRNPVDARQQCSLDLMTSIKGAEDLGSNRLNVD